MSSVRTTIALDSRHRDRLLELKRRWRLHSLDDVVARLLAGPPEGARSLYDRHKIAVDDVLTRYRVKKLVAFGSRARGDARPDSDLDLAVVLPKDADLYDFIHLRDELGDAFGVEVDMLNLDALKPAIRKKTTSQGLVLHE